MKEYRNRPGYREDHAAYCKEYYQENKEQLLGLMRQYREENNEAIRDRRRNYYEQNREAIIEKEKDYVRRNREKVSARRKIHRQKNKQKLSVVSKQYRAQNRDALNAYLKEWRGKNRQRHRELSKLSQKRRANDAAFKIVRNLRRCVHAYLTRVDAVKAGVTIELVGCTKSYLMIHLQNQFRDGMSWNNYGPIWHVDHINPLSGFNMLDEGEQRKAFHYTNLQPLLGFENLSKGNRLQWRSP